LAYFPSQILHQWSILGPGHQHQRLRDALIGKQTEKWRLLKLSCKSLPQGSIKDSIASAVPKISDDNCILVGQFRGVISAVTQNADDRSREN